jgi:LmbE family N-acetylglucosaminyl deacetylase
MRWGPESVSLPTIVAIGAHLDDIELGCGGTLARAIAHGSDVHMIVMSKSGYANYDGEVLRTEAEAEEEGPAAARELGIESLEVLDFPTKDVPYDSSTVEVLNRLLDERRPGLVISHWPHDTHQAHRSVALATLSAARHVRSVIMYEPIFPSGRSYVAFRPQLYVDITESLEQKERSLRTHASQLRKYGDAWIDAVRARSHTRGYEIGVRHAEAFEVVRYELVP